MRVQTLSIFGVGLLGGSIGLACKARANPCRIIGYGDSAASLRRALALGAIDEISLDAAAAALAADLLILCTPVGHFESILRQIAPVLKKGAVVSDVGSTKRSIVALAAKILPQTAHFVGSHPMAGSEKRGIDFARADLLANALCLMTPTPQTHRRAMGLVRDFWRQMGMRVVLLSPARHDRLLAGVSHLPHAAAAVLVAIQEPGALELAGSGFLDATRIAAGDGAIWRDIFLDNRDNLRRAIGRLQREVSRLEKRLDPSQSAALATWLTKTAARRRKLARRKWRELTPD